MKKGFLNKLVVLSLVFVTCFLLSSCNKNTTVTLHTFGEEVLLIDSNINETYELPEISNRKGYVFVGWFDNIKCEGSPITSVEVKEDLHIYAKWKAIESYKIVYCSLVTGEEEVSKEYDYFMGYDFQYLIEQPFTYKNRKIKGFSFTPNGDINVTDTISDEQMMHYCDDLGIVKLYAVWGGPYAINYQSIDGTFIDKFAMRSAYFTDFYAFIITVEGGKEHLENNNIYSAADFVTLASTWNGGGTTEMRGIGNIAGNYYLAIEVGGKLEDQPTTHFIGYCYQNNKWVDLIKFLMVFFAYWRTDEGYTGGPSDPNNTGNDFFASAWASLVDTGKMFYFTSDTLTDIYPWFTESRSPRVHKALDNVPGCLNLNNLPREIDDKDIILPNPVVEGRIFLGWYTNDEALGTPITVLKASSISDEITLYAAWKD